MYLSFRLDAARHWGIDLRKVLRVEPFEGIFVLPRQKKGVLGLYRFQQLLVPVFDFRLLLGDFVIDDLPLPHLVIFRGKESLNAFPASVEESIQEDCLMVDNLLGVQFVDPLDLIYNDFRYHQLDFSAIEEHLNIP
jgi:hypothetical protein